jgi:hypothetical protein
VIEGLPENFHPCMGRDGGEAHVEVLAWVYFDITAAFYRLLATAGLHTRPLCPTIPGVVNEAGVYCHHESPTEMPHPQGRAGNASIQVSEAHLATPQMPGE